MAAWPEDCQVSFAGCSGFGSENQIDRKEPITHAKEHLADLIVDLEDGLVNLLSELNVLSTKRLVLIPKICLDLQRSASCPRPSDQLGRETWTQDPEC